MLFDCGIHPFEILVVNDEGIIQNRVSEKAYVDCHCGTFCSDYDSDEETYVFIEEAKTTGSSQLTPTARLVELSPKPSFPNCECQLYIKDSPDPVPEDPEELDFFDSRLNYKLNLINDYIKEDNAYDQWMKPVLMMICLRFGMDKIPSEYFSSIKRVFDLEWCVGAVGGKPRKSLFFCGYQGDNLLYLDPHLVQDVEAD